MKGKQRLNLTIDNDVYMYFRFIKTDHNISDLVNNYLRTLLNAENQDKEDFGDLQEKVELLQEKKKELEKELAISLSQLSLKKIEKDKAVKEELENAVRMSNTIRNSDFLRGLE